MKVTVHNLENPLQYGNDMQRISNRIVRSICNEVRQHKIDLFGYFIMKSEKQTCIAKSFLSVCWHCGSTLPPCVFPCKSCLQILAAFRQYQTQSVFTIFCFTLLNSSQPSTLEKVSLSSLKLKGKLARVSMKKNQNISHKKYKRHSALYQKQRARQLR